MKRKFFITVLIPISFIAIMSVCIYLLNYFALQSKLNKVINADARNKGVTACVHYGYYIDKSSLVFVVKNIPNDKNLGDVFRVFLQFADEVNLDNYKKVYYVYNNNEYTDVLPEQYELQSAMEKVLSNDRNKNVEVLVYFSDLHNSQDLVYDLVNISGEDSAADIFRILLQFSEQIKEKNFDSVHLSYQGQEKFFLKGDYFQKLGKEYSVQNPVYTVRTFPENVYNPDGYQAYPTWTGGVIGVVGKQMEDFTDFYKKWYLNDWVEAHNKAEAQEIN